METLNRQRSKFPNLTLSELIIRLCDSHDTSLEMKSLEPSGDTVLSNTVSYKCFCCQIKTGSWETATTCERGTQVDTSSEVELIRRSSKLELRADGLYFNTRKSNNNNSELTLKMEYLSAKLQHYQMLPSRINDIVSTVLEVRMNAPLPCLQQHIYITHMYAIYSDLFFLEQTEGRKFCLNTDDFSRQYRPYQVTMLSSLGAEGKIEHHVAAISSIPSWTGITTRNCIKFLVQLLMRKIGFGFGLVLSPNPSNSN